MKLAITGLPQSGKSTIFYALTGARGEDKVRKASHAEQTIGTVRVADEMVGILERIYKPKKTTYAQVEYLLPTNVPTGSQTKSENLFWNQVRLGDALIHVIRNFQTPGSNPPTPESDYRRLEEEMILDDLMVSEKRLERIKLDKKRGKKPDDKEEALLKSCLRHLEENRPLRLDPDLSVAPGLKGFAFLSAKPQLIIINNDDDEDESLPQWKSRPETSEMLAVRGRLEMEITSMAPDEAEEFLVAYNIEKSALDRVIRSSYRALKCISFFTVINEEVRAWTIMEGTSALDAAGEVHSDMRKGFIRAEVLSFENLEKYGSFQEAKKAGEVGLEGKEYSVQDGDIIQFRFNI
jgi:GTP-binding protein YchF